jgi:hypothetical protein
MTTKDARATLQKVRFAVALLTVTPGPPLQAVTSDRVQAFEEQLSPACADGVTVGSLVASDLWNTHDERVRLWLQSSDGSKRLAELQQALQRAGVEKQIHAWTEGRLVSKVDILAELLKTMSKSELAEVNRLTAAALNQ